MKSALSDFGWITEGAAVSSRIEKEIGQLGENPRSGLIFVLAGV